MIPRAKDDPEPRDDGPRRSGRGDVEL